MFDKLCLRNWTIVSLLYGLHVVVGAEGGQSQRKIVFMRRSAFKVCRPILGCVAAVISPACNMRTPSRSNALHYVATPQCIGPGAHTHTHTMETHREPG